MDALVTPSIRSVTACARKFFIPPASMQRKIPRGLFILNVMTWLLKVIRRRFTATTVTTLVSPAYPRPRKLKACGLVALGAVRPDDVDRLSVPAGVRHHVGGSAVAAGGLAVPDGKQFVGGIDHELARGHVGLGGGLGERQAAHRGRLGEQPVEFGMGFGGQFLPVLAGGNDGFQAAAEVGDRSEERR